MGIQTGFCREKVKSPARLQQLARNGGWSRAAIAPGGVLWVVQKALNLIEVGLQEAEGLDEKRHSTTA
jgi:hypothetical protein